MLNDYDDEIGYVAKMNIFYNETGAGIKKLVLIIIGNAHWSGGCKAGKLWKCKSSHKMLKIAKR